MLPSLHSLAVTLVILCVSQAHGFANSSLFERSTLSLVQDLHAWPTASPDAPSHRTTGKGQRGINADAVEACADFEDPVTLRLAAEGAAADGIELILIASTEGAQRLVGNIDMIYYALWTAYGVLSDSNCFVKLLFGNRMQLCCVLFLILVFICIYLLQLQFVLTDLLH